MSVPVYEYKKAEMNCCKNKLVYRRPCGQGYLVTATFIELDLPCDVLHTYRSMNIYQDQVTSIKHFSQLNSPETEIYLAHKC